MFVTLIFRILFPLFLGAATYLGAQSKVIPHVAIDADNFTNVMVVTNPTSRTVPYRVLGYDDSGRLLQTLSGREITAGQVLFADLAQLFETLPGYLEIEGADDLEISLGFASTSANGTATYVHAGVQTARNWQLLPGNWSVIYDGVALLNRGSAAAEITLSQIEGDGTVLATADMTLAPGAKGKTVLGSLFSPQPDTLIRILSTEPLMVLGLGISQAGADPAYLWVNQPLALPDDLGTGAETNLAGYPIVDTGQDSCYNDQGQVMNCSPSGNDFSGQDAQFQGHLPSYTDNGDGTVTDMQTGLVWQQDPGEKVTFSEAVNGAALLPLGGYDDWRLPSLKELYSLIDFRGKTGTSQSQATPYLDTDYFVFHYGNESAGERYIDAQYWSSTEYVSTTMDGDETVFGVNFADGRIKGYPKHRPQSGAENFMFVRYVRGNGSYGENDFSDNGDGTVTDHATGLMWLQQDNAGLGEDTMNWQDALAWVDGLEAAGYSDWRLPNAKELQSLVDYSRSPDTHGTAAIDPLFSCSSFLDANGLINYGYYWTGTTHLDGAVSGNFAVYIAFGEALGYMEQPQGSGHYVLVDVHGAGAQRSDPKSGNPANYPHGFGPQGDVVGIYNYVRPVRDATQ